MPTRITLGLLLWLAAPRAWGDPCAEVARDSANPVAVIQTNYNDGGPLRVEFPEHLFRGAEPGELPVPPISGCDLADRILPVVISGKLHPLSGGADKLTDGSGAMTDDDPSNCTFFDNGVPVGRLRISLAEVQSIGRINLYSWHRNALSGGVRAPLKVNVYASAGDAPGFECDNPRSPGYVLLAQINTVRPGGVNAQSGQHGASVVASSGGAIGSFRHFLFEVLSPLDGLMHSFINEIDIVGAVAAPQSPAQQSATGKDFDQRVAPLLAQRCLGCHNPTDKKGGLDLSRFESALAGGDSGAAIEPHSADSSLLLTRVLDDEMPPKSPLPASEKQLLKEWIAAGAAWGTSPIDRFRCSSDTRAGYDWWALRPLVRPALPELNDPHGSNDQDGPVGPIDRLVRDRLHKAGLSPAPAADRRTLIRRLSFDLIGLPPSPEEVAAFVDDKQPDAYGRLVDRLLASPHYGERWAQHWLDVVRFAESQGFERNKFYPSAWKYRDWVIESLNEDLPYDEFMRLQLAGDVLRPQDPLALIATGYLTCARTICSGKRRVPRA